MYLWRKRVGPQWLKVNEETLQEHAGTNLAAITRPGQKRSQLEAACRSRKEAQQLVQEFGGRIERLPRDWLKRFARRQKSEPIKIGKRLIILRTREKREAGSFPYSLVISPGAAFGTGEHVTTAMSLRLLEKVSRELKLGWSMADLGTGSGILTLAANRLGAARILGIDNDPSAVRTAKENARTNKIDNVNFKLADVRDWKMPRRKIDIVAANLSSELLIEIVPKLRGARWLILSGVLRNQERRLRRALRSNKIDIVETRRRGKWVAILAKGRDDPLSHP